MKIRDWSSKQTAEWWIRADKSYEQRQINEPSKEYFINEYNFESALEVGSGTGRLINSLSGRRGAIDINPHLLEKVDDNVTKYVFDASKPIPLNLEYDLVYTYQVLQHLNHSQFLRALKNIKRFAKKEIWLVEGQVPGFEDGQQTHPTGSYHHDYTKYIDCYRIDSLHGGKVMVHRAKVK